MSQLDIRAEPYEGPTATQLIGEVQAEYVVRYGGPDTTPVEPDEFAPPRGRFLVGYLDAVPVAMGGLRRYDDATVEIKRMYVVPAHRGAGLSRQMLAALEAGARAMGAERILLETGMKQPEAMRLYETSGYRATCGYGHYAGATDSRSYEKIVTATGVPVGGASE